MTYNYVNQNNKYNLITLEDDTQTFIFELLLKDKFNNITIIRKIKKKFNWIKLNFSDWHSVVPNQSKQKI